MSLREQLKLWNRNQAGVIDEADRVLQEVTRAWPRELSYQILAPYLCPRLPRAELMSFDFRSHEPHHIRLDIDSQIIKIYIYPHLVKCELGALAFRWAFTRITEEYSLCGETNSMPDDDQLVVVRDLVEGLLLPFLFLYDGQLHVPDPMRLRTPMDFVCFQAKRATWSKDGERLDICTFTRAPSLNISLSRGMQNAIQKLSEDTPQSRRMFSRLRSKLEQLNRELGIL